MSKKEKQVKQRNYMALKAWQMSGAGFHKDNKKYSDKYLCRENIDDEDIYNEYDDDDYIDE